ncbi:MAG: monovalent cation/H+ antiporter complex subunit F [Planctomycetota bacterium]
MIATETVIRLAAIVILVGIFLVLMRALKGPTVFDRILAVNAMGTKAVIFLILLGFASRGEGRSGFLDIALLYALVNFAATVAILKYVRLRRLS